MLRRAEHPSVAGAGGTFVSLVYSCYQPIYKLYSYQLILTEDTYELFKRLKPTLAHYYQTPVRHSVQRSACKPLKVENLQPHPVMSAATRFQLFYTHPNGALTMACDMWLTIMVTDDNNPVVRGVTFSPNDLERNQIHDSFWTVALYCEWLNHFIQFQPFRAKIEAVQAFQSHPFVKTLAARFL